MLSGANDFGQLGDGTEEGRKFPKKVKQLETEFVKSVSCGAHCTVAIAEPRDNDGSVSTRRLWIWGQNQVFLSVLMGNLGSNFGHSMAVISNLFLFIPGIRFSASILGGLYSKYGVYSTFIQVQIAWWESQTSLWLPLSFYGLVIASS